MGPAAEVPVREEKMSFINVQTDCELDEWAGQVAAGRPGEVIQVCCFTVEVHK